MNNLNDQTINRKLGKQGHEEYIYGTGSVSPAGNGTRATMAWLKQSHRAESDHGAVECSSGFMDGLELPCELPCVASPAGCPPERPRA